MNRPYTLKKRAKQQAETRQRIVEATVALHTKHGPARTTISMIADAAGVQRHTVYAHFPDEMSLQMACSDQHMTANPFPDAGVWADVLDAGERLRLGLEALYGWYERNEEIAAHVQRDAEHHDVTREISMIRYGPPMAVYTEVLGSGLTEGQRPMLQLAFSFYSWRTLVREAGLDTPAAAAAMAQAILSV